ncbi:hypothetical protein DPMN_024041 [Dreissena polymorpha]|uniref:Uncharacterized protein n=1 Tax=Dreissena polymorpha TaxID=45954 RepID=A0A9D4LM89_DREPO|nr:hypothetical protein DPMN_024041 [Dreissena polymorpha]
MQSQARSPCRIGLHSNPRLGLNAGLLCNPRLGLHAGLDCYPIPGWVSMQDWIAIQYQARSPCRV